MEFRRWVMLSWSSDSWAKTCCSGYYRVKIAEVMKNKAIDSFQHIVLTWVPYFLNWHIQLCLINAHLSIKPHNIRGTVVESMNPPDPAVISLSKCVTSQCCHQENILFNSFALGVSLTLCRIRPTRGCVWVPDWLSFWWKGMRTIFKKHN